MKHWDSCGALSVMPGTLPGRFAIEDTPQQVRKDSRWRKCALTIFLLFACSYTIVIFLSGTGCSPSSIASCDLGELDSACCRFASWSSGFFSSTSDTVRGPSISVLETRTSIERIVFGIGASERSWTVRSEYIKLWWKPGVTRGYIWVDQNLTSWKNGDPPVRVSEDTSRFSFTHSTNARSALRISRIVLETFRLELPDVDWFVMGDDDTLFFPENLVEVLSKYDPRRMHYVGTNSEDTRQSERHQYGLAFGGGGFAISYPLAKALSDVQDECLERYSWLYGSDERVKACVSELGVPMTKEPGFHQLDIRGDISGFLAAHPVSPIVSLHHLNDMRPLFYGRSHLDDLKRLLQAVRVDSASMFQQSICYDSERRWSFSVAWGYVVEVYEGFLNPRELEMPVRTFASWAGSKEFAGFTFDTRPLAAVCNRPTRFFMVSAQSEGNGTKKVGMSSYERLTELGKENCTAKSAPMDKVRFVKIEKEPLSDDWYKNPQRQCCTVKNMNSTSIIIRLGACSESESLVVGVSPVEAERRSRQLLA